MEKKTNDSDIVMDKNGNILYSPTKKAEATESLGGATATLSPTEAVDYLNEIVANSEKTPIPETAPDDAKTASFKEPFNAVEKKYRIKFKDRNTDVLFLFKAQSSCMPAHIDVYWQSGECPMSGGKHRCCGSSRPIEKSSIIEVKHPITYILESTIFIHKLEVSAKYMSADLWIYDHSGSKR